MNNIIEILNSVLLELEQVNCCGYVNHKHLTNATEQISMAREELSMQINKTEANNVDTTD